MGLPYMITDGRKTWHVELRLAYTRRSLISWLPHMPCVGAMHAGVLSLRHANLPHLGRRLRLPWMQVLGENVLVLAEGGDIPSEGHAHYARSRLYRFDALLTWARGPA